MAQNDWTMSWCAFKSRARAKLTGKDAMARSMTRRQRTAATRAHTSTTLPNVWRPGDRAGGGGAEASAVAEATVCRRELEFQRCRAK